MTRVAKVKKPKVIFDDLKDIEDGDVLQIHFIASSTDGATSLMGMIRSGAVTSPNVAKLSIVAALGIWGDRSNQYIEVEATRAFDWEWFEASLTGEIDKLLVKSRVRPLIDLGLLDVPDISLNYRFNSERLDGVLELLNLHRLGLVRLDSFTLLAEAYLDGRMTEAAQSGRLITHLAGEGNLEDRADFVTNVVPYLRLLRS